MNQNYTLLLLRKNQELLLAMKKHGYSAGKWNGAGGKVKAGESIEDALKRKAVEEIGVQPLSFKKVAVLEIQNESNTESAAYHMHVYIADKWKGDLEETGEMAPMWFHPWEIPFDHMWENDVLWLPMVLSGKKLNCRFVFDKQGNLKEAQLNIVKELK